MTHTRKIDLDALIFGGGAAGLWILDELHRRGFSTLLIETNALGAGQSVASQGIIHGGIKYALSGLFAPSARAIRHMPGLWRDCLAGRKEPRLVGTRVLAEQCYLWRTQSLRSKMGLGGARVGLRSHVERLAPADRPAVLGDCPGDVFSVNEQVIDVVSFLHDLGQRHRARIVKVAEDTSIRFVSSGGGNVQAVVLSDSQEGEVELRAAHVVLSAGAGNAALRKRIGLAADAMQRRPLHMVMVRGDLPRLFGHCVDGAKTRVTITTAMSRTDGDGACGDGAGSGGAGSGSTVWHVGGQVAEDGVGMDAPELIQHAKRELLTVLPGVELDMTEWSTYRIDRAEARTPGGARPENVTIRKEGNVITAWPTKLALAPLLARMIADGLGTPRVGASTDQSLLPDWPRPEVALPPWTAARPWHA